MKFPVYLQDITAMTALRSDGHPSVYKRVISQGERQKAGKGLSSDCSHWCLPGVPDIWNEMLSALLDYNRIWVMGNVNSVQQKML